MLLRRISYALHMCYAHRHRLLEIYQQTPASHCLSMISEDWLKQQGIRVIVLDFDGVLSSHGEPEPREELFDWLQRCVQYFSVERVFVLTNKPMPERLRYFEQRHAGLKVITGVRKKPYPDGLEQVLELTKVQRQEMLMVDDRLLTGVLAAGICDMQAAYIRKPYTNFRHHPFKESFFLLLRTLESQAMASYQRYRQLRGAGSRSHQAD